MLAKKPNISFPKVNANNITHSPATVLYAVVAQWITRSTPIFFCFILPVTMPLSFSQSFRAIGAFYFYYFFFAKGEVFSRSSLAKSLLPNLGIVTAMALTGASKRS